MSVSTPEDPKRWFGSPCGICRRGKEFDEFIGLWYCPECERLGHRTCRCCFPKGTKRKES